MTAACGLLSFILGLFNLVMLACGSVIIWAGYMINFNPEKFMALITKISKSLGELFTMAENNTAVLEEIGKTLDAKLGIAFIILGVVVVLIGFFGLFSAVCQLGVFEIPYMIFMGVLLIALITMTSIFATRTDLTREVIGNAEYKLFKTMYNSKESSGFTRLWDRLQRETQCCGVHNYTDYQVNNLAVPDSCCKTSNCQVNLSRDNSYIDSGCEEKIWNSIKRDYTNILIGMGITCAIVAVPLLIVLITACQKKSTG
ncbi:Tetraspanin [Cichlidogyrus casuarinus]|uniref:Tetraspanin n=1 Tax=Cichlidogyrus casuarinus TaxID=1844966 RepID=A0ABD2PZN3_9PLAT